MNQTAGFIRKKFFLTFVVLSAVVVPIGRAVFHKKITKIVEVKNYSTDEKREIINTFDTKDQNNQGFPMDPFDLMNRIKKAGAMDNATTPSDALDEALNAFDESEY